MKKTRGARVVEEFFERMRELKINVRVRGVVVTPADFQTKRDDWRRQAREAGNGRG